jgi:hypothetical protein
MYNTQNRGVSGLCPSFGNLDIRKHSVPETGCFRPHERGKWVYGLCHSSRIMIICIREVPG